LGVGWWGPKTSRRSHVGVPANRRHRLAELAHKPQATIAWADRLFPIGYAPFVGGSSGGYAAGRRMRNSVPPSGRLNTSMSPP
jgi:hypothetical protein